MQTYREKHSPVVVSDPLIPNRKAKDQSTFKGVAQGTKAAPGLCFDLDRNTGLYQSAYDELGWVLVLVVFI